MWCQSSCQENPTGPSGDTRYPRSELGNLKITMTHVCDETNTRMSTLELKKKNVTINNNNYNNSALAVKLNPYYLSGFADAESSFAVNIIKSKSNKLG